MSLRGARILVVDDDDAAVAYLVDELTALGAVVDGETQSARVIERLEKHAYDVIVSDVEMPRVRGIDLLSQIRAQRPTQLVILVTAFGSIDLAVESVRRGAADFIAKPFRMSVLVTALERALRERALGEEVASLRRTLAEGVEPFIAHSAAMVKVSKQVKEMARSTAPVLLTGESGTGKGRVARLIHDSSRRAGRPFVTLNCAALPGSLVEAELFGVRRGAFTGADEDRPGVFLEAEGGTLFLDEVTELALELQPKLLRAIESGSIRPVGGKGEVAVDVRVVAATNREVKQALHEQKLRSDLYFRLAVLSLEVPPLRERREDIPALVEVQLARINRRRSGDEQLRGASPEALAALTARSWPGNVRELGNAIERAAARRINGMVEVSDIDNDDPLTAELSLSTAVRERRSLEFVEAVYARMVLASVAGNASEAARILGIDRRTLAKKLETPAQS